MILLLVASGFSGSVGWELDRTAAAQESLSQSYRPRLRTVSSHCKLCWSVIEDGLAWHNFYDGIASLPGTLPWHERAWSYSNEGDPDDSEFGFIEQASLWPHEASSADEHHGALRPEEEGPDGKFDCHSFNACHGNLQIDFCGMRHHKCSVVYHELVEAVQSAVRTRSLASMLALAAESNGRVHLDGKRARIFIRDCEGNEVVLSMV
ncbi:MAG: hypothetical protein MUD17_10375 [Gemmatimonadaceae bacterium]|nr:hypothetical protein [Gemmatimonadaceae bacterium]